MQTRRKRLIGISVSHGFAFFREVVEGIRRYAERRPEWFFATVVPETRLLDPAGGQQPDGLIISIDTRAIARAMQAWKRPLVEVSALVPGLTCPFVRVDNARVAELAFQHFVERGLRQFAFAGHPRWLYSRQRELAFRHVLRNAGHDLHVYHTRIGGEFDPVGRVWPLDRGVRRWLQRLPKPVGLFVPNDQWGVQVTEACRELQLHIPDQIALLSVDNDPLLCGLCRPPLSSVVLPAQQVGYEAARLLDTLLAGSAPAETQILLPPVGISTRSSTDILATDDPETADAIRYVREYAHLPLQIDDVVREFSIGRRTLERRVRQFLGHPLGHEIVRVRLERARHLLATSDMPIKQVARQAGFTDARHLSVMFRRALRQSPTAYRRAARLPRGEK